jgi:uncharacterized protein (TIGR03067 family)
MKNAIALAPALSLFGLFAAAAPAPREPAKKDSPVVGVWVESRGELGDLTITFTADGKLKFDDGKSPAEWGAYKVNDKGDPPEIDYVTPARSDPANGKPPLLGIYRVDKDTLTLYLSERTRPTNFDAPDGSGVMRLTLRRPEK